MTNIWPSQYCEAPIPIVGILMVLVINLANELSTHSRTIKKLQLILRVSHHSKFYFAQNFFFL